MSGEYARLRAELRAAVEFVERQILSMVRREEALLRQAPPDEGGSASWTLSTSKCLHDFYASIEQRIFERIADETGEGRPRSQEYHARLLEVMATDVPGVRPAVLCEATRRSLERFRRFHHVHRHVYAPFLRREEILALCGEIDGAWRGVQEDLTEFLARIAPASTQ